MEPLALQTVLDSALRPLNELFTKLVGAGRFKFILDPVQEKEAPVSSARFRIFTTFSDRKFYWYPDETWKDSFSNCVCYYTVQDALDVIHTAPLSMLGKSVYVEEGISGTVKHCVAGFSIHTKAPVQAKKESIFRLVLHTRSRKLYWDGLSRCWDPEVGSATCYAESYAKAELERLDMGPDLVLEKIE